MPKSVLCVIGIILFPSSLLRVVSVLPSSQSSKPRVTKGFSTTKIIFKDGVCGKNFFTDQTIVGSELVLRRVLVIMMGEQVMRHCSGNFRNRSPVSDASMEIIGRTQKTIGQEIFFKLGGSLTVAKCSRLLE